MRLYYFTSDAVAIQHILPERRLKLSQFHELNDPFELEAFALGDKKLRQIARALQREYFGKKGIICFSDNWRSPVMWAHYAIKHSGICFGFDIGRDGADDDIVRQVAYESDRLRFQLQDGVPLFGIDENFVKAMLYTKANEWAYEREWRVTADLAVRDLQTGFHYVDFGPQMQLREVILGARNHRTPEKVANLVSKNLSDVTVFKTRPAFRRFAMTRDRLTPRIIVQGE
ncbi:DUF2971 domain-containing protein [Duganella sp. sic0402]|uniref:DUF2971 domain-containing protein n=1 Tax=Duganella sp. sic0402 TaxID=2854786 RepID=UPI001C4507BB|nr:DUF2971 domain-containing protein [Duganella sp. sic0402]MBV7534919.1 DUF2971 domain-containing protein [Duganella sp. sic0402]